MTRLSITAALIAAIGFAAQAGNPPENQLRALVAKELPSYVQGVDVSTLSQHQLAHIYSILHGPYSGMERKAMLRSAIGGGYSLRGLLFN